MRRDKYRQSDEKKFNTLYGSNFSRDTRELTPEQRRYLEIVEEERKYGSRRRENDRRAIRREKRKKRFAGMNKPVKPGSKKKKIAVIILTLIILILGLGYLYLAKLASNLDFVSTNKEDFDIDPTVEKTLEDYRCVAILGSDARKGQGYDGSRTDAIIVAVIQKSTGNIQLVSVMRDSYLKIEDANKSEKLDKITHAHAFGGGVNTCNSLNRSMDLNISEFVIFNWKAVSDLVNEMGGIEVNIKSNEINDLNRYGPETAQNVGGKYKPVNKTGKQIIDGPQAATYCRIRKSSGGDPGRGSRMKIVMSALMKKAKETKISTLNDVAERVFPEIRTNITKTGILKTIAQIPSYEFGKNRAWPKDYYGGLLNGVWYAVPITLESQIRWLYKTTFDKKGYEPTSRAKSISNEIINRTGVQ